jgi:hypothetical protein
MWKFLIILFFIPYLNFAQPGFNIAYQSGHTNNKLYGIAITNDTIVAYGTAQDSSFGYRKGLLLMKFDTLGNLLSQNLKVDTTNLLTIDKYWGKIISTSDGGYAMTAAAIYGSNGVLLKVNNNLEVEFYQVFVDTFNKGEAYIAPIEISGGFLLYGFFNRPNLKFDAFIRKVDTQGNTVWWKTYGVNNRFEYFRSMTPLQDSLFAFAGNTFEDQGDFANPWICVIDVNGEVVREWKAPVGYTAFDDMHFAFPTADSGWLTYSVADLGLPPFTNGWVRNQSTWVRLDSNFQVQWTKRHGPNIYYIDFFHDFVRAPNGDIIAAGERGPYDPGVEGYYRKGWVMRFNSEGDSLWQWAGTLDPAVNTTHFLGGLGLLSSGSIVAAGQSTEAGGTWSCWLVKLTPDGCVDTLYCNTVATPEPSDEGGQLRVFPNPARTSGTVGYDGSDALRSLAVFDLQGRSKLFLAQPRRTQTLDVTTMPDGVYFVRLETAGGNTALAKLVVKR